jgi:hypothetical protein
MKHKRNKLRKGQPKSYNPESDQNRVSKLDVEETYIEYALKKMGYVPPKRKNKGNTRK